CFATLAMTLLRAPVDYFVVRCALVEPLQHRAGLRWHVADAIILTDERLDCVEAIEPHQGLELDLIAEVALHQVDVAEARDPACLDSRNYFAADDPLIGISVLRRGPPAPQAADHFFFCSCARST